MKYVAMALLMSVVLISGNVMADVTIDGDTWPGADIDLDGGSGIYVDGEPFTGIPGQDGADGLDGQDGLDGINGIDGADGADGVDGIDGQDGKDGLDGKDAEERRNPAGVGVDLLLWHNDSNTMGFETQYKYDIQNEEHSAFGVIKVNVWDMFR